MNDDTLIKAQDNIIKFLMEGTKGRRDFWNNPIFMNDPTKERGIYPRKNLHLMQDAGIIEKIYINKKVHWRIVEGAFFRMEGKEYDWSYVNPNITTAEPTFFFGDGIQKPLDENTVEVLNEIEDYPYLNKVKDALEKPKKNWLKKLKLWK